MFTRYGEEAARLFTEVVWLESAMRERASRQRIEDLQLQLDDARTVLHFREREVARLKATKGRTRIRELGQRCAALEEALARKPVDEAAERVALIDDILLDGEKIAFQTLFSEEGVLVAPGWDGYCAFCHTATPEQLAMAKAANSLVLQGREGRKRLEVLC